jgi:hypothetical protein
MCIGGPIWREIVSVERRFKEAFAQFALPEPLAQSQDGGDQDFPVGTE